MTLPRLWAFLAIALPVLAACIANLSAVDLAYHLRAGTITLDTGHIPTTDSFTFTANGAPWLNQQWGAQAILAAVFRVGGWTGLFVLRAVLVGLTFGLLFEACRRRQGDLRCAAWLTLAAFVISAVALALRPQLFGMVLMALTLLLVVDRRAHPERLWVIPVIVLVWANIHGSFFLGPVVLGLAWLEDRRERIANADRTLLIALLSAAAAVVNPFGVGIWGYALGLTANPFITSQISEWQPTTLRTIPGMIFFASVAVVAVLLTRRGRAVPWTTFVWIGVFAAIGAYAIRGVAWWPLGAAVAVAGVLAIPDGSEAARERSAPRLERLSRLNLVVAGLIGVLCLVVLPIWRGVDTRVGAPAGLVGDAPPGITAALRDVVAPGDRIFNPQPWGSWLEFAFPDQLVALDSRIEVFATDVWTDYEVIRSGGARWQETLGRWHPAWVVATRDDSEFAARLVSAGWRDAYHDGDGMILAAP